MVAAVAVVVAMVPEMVEKAVAITAVAVAMAVVVMVEMAVVVMVEMVVTILAATVAIELDVVVLHICCGGILG